MPLRDEILEQPMVLRRLTDEGRPAVERVAAVLRRDDVHWIYIAARGSSDHAAIYAKYLFGIHNRIPTALAAPSVFTLYGGDVDLQHSVVVGISQSGESPDIVRVVSAARSQGRPTVAITNSPSSPMARQADIVLDVQAGEEKSVAATKSYTAQLTALAMLSAAIANESRRWEDLRGLPEWMSLALDAEETAKEAAEHFDWMDRCVVLGRGFNYATSFEWALKLKELSGIFAEPFSSADFMHGPIAAVGGQSPVLAVAPSGQAMEDILGVLRRLAEEWQPPILVISDREEALRLGQERLPLPSGIPEWLTPIVAIAAAQLFCYWLTVHKGLDPERPRGLSKVTHTT